MSSNLITTEHETEETKKAVDKLEFANRNELKQYLRN